MRLLEQVDEVVVAHGLHDPALLLAEEVAGAADLQVLHGQPEARAELAELLEGLQPLAGQRASGSMDGGTRK